MNSNHYLEVKQNIATIAQQHGRNPDDITLVVVSKGYSWENTISAVYAAGCRDFGENRLQEALTKISTAPRDVQWHMLGTLQSNKVNKAVGTFALIHSVHHFELAQMLSEYSVKANTTAPILLQVNTSGETTKKGLTITEWKTKLEQLSQLPGIVIKGFMTMAPLVDDKAIIRDCFSRLRDFRDEVNALHPALKEANHLSMGMSHDYPVAIEQGATLLRIGRAIFQ